MEKEARQSDSEIQCIAMEIVTEKRFISHIWTPIFAVRSVRQQMLQHQRYGLQCM